LWKEFADSKEELTEIFRTLGADDPEGWAQFEIEGGDQLATYAVLKKSWDTVVNETDTSWIEENIERAKERPNDHFAGIGHALHSLREKGATNEELVDLVRGMQVRTMDGMFWAIDPGGADIEGLEGLSWMLFLIDEDGSPRSEVIGPLYEYTLTEDPTGREMRPRPSKD
jgi:hypothetical protein